MDWLPGVVMGVSTALTLVLVVQLRRALPRVQAEEWRDRPPWLFRLLSPLVAPLVPVVARHLDPRKREILQTRLERSGMSYAIRVEEIVLARRVGLAAGIALLLYVQVMLEPGLGASLLLLAVPPMGYYYPDLWLRDTTRRRQSRIEKEFPFFLELLVLVMRAGLNFSSAVAHAAGRLPPGPLKDELERTLREVRTGASRRDALGRLGRRIDLASVTGFVAAINQAEETGGALGDILSQQARQRRSERFLRAEKLANQAPVKLLGPLVGLLFPITFIIIAFPIFIKARDSGTLGFLQ